MLENGVRIKSIQAGSLYDVNLGVRDNLDMKDAVLSNSLFLAFVYLLKVFSLLWLSDHTVKSMKMVKELTAYVKKRCRLSIDYLNFVI